MKRFRAFCERLGTIGQLEAVIFEDSGSHGEQGVLQISHLLGERDEVELS